MNNEAPKVTQKDLMRQFVIQQDMRVEEGLHADVKGWEAGKGRIPVVIRFHNARFVQKEDGTVTTRAEVSSLNGRPVMGHFAMWDPTALNKKGERVKTVVVCNAQKHAVAFCFPNQLTQLAAEEAILQEQQAAAREEAVTSEFLPEGEVEYANELGDEEF